MTAFATRMFLDWLDNGEIPSEDLPGIIERIYNRDPGLKPVSPVNINFQTPHQTPAPPGTLIVGSRVRIKNIRPTYLLGIEGVLGKEYNQRNRYAVYLDPATIATIDKRAMKYVLTSRYRSDRYISVTLNMLEPA